MWGVTPQTPGAAHTLVLVRHSKASHDAPTDLERPLTPRGGDLADALARKVSSRVPEVQTLLVSPAARTRQTALPLADYYPQAAFVVEPAIYHAGVERILALIRALDETTRAGVVVGHEPTISALAYALHDADDDELARQVSFGLPTATACVLEVPVPWAVLGARSAHLYDVLSARR